MFDCVGYVFGSGLVFPIDKKKKSERKKKEKRGREQGNKKKESGYICCFQFALRGQTQLTALTSGHLKIRARTWLLSPVLRSPPPTARASFYADAAAGNFYPFSPVAWLTYS